LKRESIKYEDFFRRLNSNKGKSYKPFEMVGYYNLLKDSSEKAHLRITEYDQLIADEIKEVYTIE
jgi:hypothetical protein